MEERVGAKQTIKWGFDQHCEPLGRSLTHPGQTPSAGISESQLLSTKNELTEIRQAMRAGCADDSGHAAK